MNARRPENHLRRALRSLKDIDIELQNGSSLVENNICKTIFHSYESKTFRKFKHETFTNFELMYKTYFSRQNLVMLNIHNEMFKSACISNLLFI